MSSNRTTDCLAYEKMFADRLTDTLSHDDSQRLNTHIRTCDHCQKEFESLTALWGRLGILEDERPSEAFRQNFYAMMETYSEKQNKKIGRRIRNWRSAFRLQSGFATSVLGIVLIVTGILIGTRLQNDPPSKGENLQDVRINDSTRAARPSLALLNEKNPGERIKGITRISKISNPDPPIINKLLYTLNNDDNINVRLSAIDALFLFADQPQVRTGLSDALQKQASPIVQLALIDLITELRLKRGRDALKKLIIGQKVNIDVKRRAEDGLYQLM